MMTKDSDLTKDDDQVSDWTKGLPSSEELTPLSHTLISHTLGSAFRIKHEEPMTAEDVQRESQATMRNLFNHKSSAPSFDAFPAFQEEDASGYGYGSSELRRVEEEFRGKHRADDDEDEFRANQDRDDEDEFRANQDREDERLPSTTAIPRLLSSGSGTEKTTAGENAGRENTLESEEAERPDQLEGADLEPEDANPAGGPASSAEDPNAKRTRLVWTPQLHKRFVEAVGHLDIKNAVPKTIMQLMNVEGLTRENVASHLQKYRLYLKRMHGLSTDEDHLFASTPLPPPGHDAGAGGGPFQMPMGFMRPGQFGGFEHVPYGGGFMHPAAAAAAAANAAVNESRSRNAHHWSLANSSSQCELPLFPRR